MEHGIKMINALVPYAIHQEFEDHHVSPVGRVLYVYKYFLRYGFPSLAACSSIVYNKAHSNIWDWVPARAAGRF